MLKPIKKPGSSCPITPLPKKIGPYDIVKKIASGGMGEVFLAKDPFCKRNLALKKIRSDRIDQPGFKERFLKEVKIAAQLSHPSIIPIYQIHQIDKEIYYTMPLVEGETLKEILKKTLSQEKQGLAEHPIGSSIPALMRIFLNVCQAIAYSHSKGILHRDLKPENIIVGKYGEVFILDWGLADFVENCQPETALEEEVLECEHPGLTRPGKIAGTLCYLPPERILGVKASYSSDIYSLGVILYQLLTLRFPFIRKSVREYKKQMRREQLIDPAERAPYRDIPPQLSKIAKKCLSSYRKKRYTSIQNLLKDLNNYIEGHAEWSPCSSLQVDHKADWEFQENILLAKQIALTQKSDVMEWVNFMMAKQVFPGNIKFETHVRVQESGAGIGLLLTMNSDENKKEFFQDALFLWVGSEQNPGSSLFRSNVEVMSSPNIYLKSQMSHFLKIKKTENHLTFYLNDVLVFDYLSHIPLNTPHFGIILKDDEIEIGSILVSSSSPNIMVNCLAVPDAFFALRQFKQALIEYRQIGKSFFGRAEGREATFRAGITLLEEAQTKRKAKEKDELFKQALEEFGLLRNTPGAPLEYLGKSLVYKATQELDEEMKCLELALRKFKKNSLTHLIKDQILFRLHEASYKDLKSAFHLALLALRFIPEAFSKPDNQSLLHNLQKNCEPPSFLFSAPVSIELQLAFYLYKPFALEDLFRYSSSLEEKFSYLISLLHLGFFERVPDLLQEAKKDSPLHLALSILSYFHKKGLVSTLDAYFSSPMDLSSPFIRSTLSYILDPFQKMPLLDQKKVVHKLETISEWNLPLEEKLFIEDLLIQWLFYIQDPVKAAKYLNDIPESELSLESSPFFFLHACQIASTQGDFLAKEKLCRRPEGTFTPLFCLIDAFFLSELPSIDFLDHEPFFWRKERLLKQLILFYRSAQMQKEEKTYHQKLNKEIKNARPRYSNS